MSKRRKKKPRLGYLLHALPDEDSAILESFIGEPPPTRAYVEEMFGDGYLFEYDVENRLLVNGRLVEPR